MSPKSIGFSFLAHAALLALLFGGFALTSGDWHSGGGGGEGGVSTAVWVTGMGPQKAITGSSVSMKALRDEMSVRGAPESTPDVPTSAKSAGAGGGSGGGEGVGGGADVGPSAGTGGGGDDALSKIWREIDKKKYYPPIAKKNRLEGSPKVTFEIDQSGKIISASLIESCGIKVLDDAALETLRRVDSLPPYPKPITVALRYSMRD